MNKYRWSMSKYDFERLKENLKKEYSPSDNCYCGVAIGSLLLEFATTDENKEVILYINTYKAGVDSGYGYLEDGTPYDCIDTYVSIKNLNLKADFDTFKESVYKEIERTADDHIRKMMNSEMKPMWYGFQGKGI